MRSKGEYFFKVKCSEPLVEVGLSSERHAHSDWPTRSIAAGDENGIVCLERSRVNRRGSN